jgi:ParB family chromosome partitioning protein
MHSQNIQLKDLHVSPFNMRAEKKIPSLARMAEISANIIPSVREKGILQDLIVRKNNAGFEIVAGRRRFYAAKVVENERGAFEAIKCNVVEPGDDANALELSLIENVAREDVDELTQYQVYTRLIVLGRTPAQIAVGQGVTEHQVRQRLALANLLPQIRDLFREGELETEDLQTLTLATKTQQRSFLKLVAEGDAPRGRYLKDWLFGGDAISTKAALFAVEFYTGEIRQDLFGEEAYFLDTKRFWTLQDEAIAAKRDDYLAAKWAEVIVMARGERWDNWNYAKAQKKDGARVYIAVAENGEVATHEGYLTHDELRRAKTKKEKAKKGEKIEDEADKKAKSPITAAMRNYLDLHRHAAVRLAVIARPSDALRLMIAHAVAASGNWNVKPDSRRADSTAIGESIEASEARKLFAAEAKAVAKLLAPAFKSEDAQDDDEDASVAGRGYQDDALTARVFARLLKLKDVDVARIGAFVMAETLASGSAVTDAFGAYAKVETRAHWTPDQTFVDLMRDRTAVNGMLADLSGKKAADKLVSAKLKDQKAALATAAAASTDWCPGWMAFPATYL